jgi:hypothetical protein
MGLNYIIFLNAENSKKLIDLKKKIFLKKEREKIFYSILFSTWNL